jgi:hypothetical protein
VFDNPLPIKAATSVGLCTSAEFSSPAAVYRRFSSPVQFTGSLRAPGFYPRAYLYKVKNRFPKFAFNRVTLYRYTLGVAYTLGDFTCQLSQGKTISTVDLKRSLRSGVAVGLYKLKFN